MVATLPPPETLQSSIKPEKPEKRSLPSLGVGKEAKQEKARGSPHSFPPPPSSGGRRAAARPAGAAVRPESSPTAAVRTSHGPAGPAPPSSNSPQSSERRERAPPGQKHTAQTSQTEARGGKARAKLPPAGDFGKKRASRPRARESPSERSAHLFLPRHRLPTPRTLACRVARPR